MPEKYRSTIFYVKWHRRRHNWKCRTNKLAAPEMWLCATKWTYAPYRTSAIGTINWAKQRGKTLICISQMLPLVAGGRCLWCAKHIALQLQLHIPVGSEFFWREGSNSWTYCTEIWNVYSTLSAIMAHNPLIRNRSFIHLFYGFAVAHLLLSLRADLLLCSAMRDERGGWGAKW